MGMTRNAGEANRNSKLKWDQVREIRAQYVRGSKDRNTLSLARKYGVGQTAIREIVNHRKWKES